MLNAGAQRVVEAMVAEADALRVAVSRGRLGETLVDAGAGIEGGISAGLMMARAASGDAAEFSVGLQSGLPRWPLTLSVRSSRPVEACLASQYAGWNLSTKDYFAMGSGPARVLARTEALFEKIAHRETAQSTVIILESGKPPPPSVVERVTQATGLAASAVTFIYAPTQSIAGTVQIVARALEVALHKADSLGFPLDRIVDGAAMAPIPAPHPDFLVAMGRTNDAIIYGGTVQLLVRGTAAEARDLARDLPSCASRDYGEPFATVFEKFHRNFYDIDPKLFSPAEVFVTALDSGETFRAGERDVALLARSLG